uniref:PUM-HD domain-containing protein n=1 Tax=Globodera pallida TaxID=36090 RepID=A0A183CED0_GLOPA
MAHYLNPFEKLTQSLKMIERFIRNFLNGQHIIRKVHRAKLVDALRGHVLTLALHKSGSHVIRAVLESVDKASQIEIINEISAQVIPLPLHKYGNWVIQFVLEHCTQKRLVQYGSY